MPDILLTCSILGPDVSRVFPVVISSDNNIGQLKDAIKEKDPDLNHITAHKCDIWKPPTPFFEDTIGDQLKGVIDGGKIPGANRLRATALLSSHFSDVPVPGTGTVDLVVQLPPSALVLGKRPHDVLVPPKALVEFHQKIWNNPDAYNDVFSTRQVKRDSTLADVDIPSHRCVMHPPYIYSAKYITGILIRNEYVQAIKDIIAFYIGEGFAPNADNNKGSDGEADMVMRSGDVGLDGDTVMETSVRGAAPSAPTSFPTAIDNPFLRAQFPPEEGVRCGVIVTGSPGIGKSVLLNVILHLRNLAGRETIFIQDNGRGDFFTATGVSRMSRDDITQCELSPSVWVLVDSGRDLTGVPEWVTRLGCFIVQAASPRPARLEWEKKEIQVSRYFLMPWSLEEALAGRMLQRTATPTEAELKAFFERCIPSARAAYAHASTIPQYDQGLVQQFSNLSVADVIGAASQDFRIDDKLPHHIFVILPGETRSEHVIEFASRYFARTLVTNVKEANAASALYQVFSRNAKTRGAAGQLLDSVVRDIFTRSDVWTIREMERSLYRGPKNQHWKIQPSSTHVDKYLITGHPDHLPVWVSDERPPKDVVLQRIETYLLPSTGRITLRTGYWVPDSATEATFDSFYYEANEKRVTVLQLTVSNSHSMNIKGLKRLRDLGVKSVCYVAVSGPQEDFDLPVPHEYSNFLSEKYLLVLESLT